MSEEFATKPMPAAPVNILAAMLFLSIFPFPIGYYALLKIVAFGVFGWAAYTSFKRGSQSLGWAFAFLALVFNPVVDFAFGRPLWIAIDLLSLIFLLKTRKYLTGLVTSFSFWPFLTLKQALLLLPFGLSVLMLVAFANASVDGQWDSSEDFFAVAFWGACAFVCYWFGFRDRNAS